MISSLRLVIAAVVLVVISQGCAVDGLSFRADDRVSILAPAENSTVELPFEMRWEARDFDGQFLVLFNRPPMRPNEGLDALVPRRDPCHQRAGCPDEDWLAERQMFLTDGTQLMIRHLPDRRSNSRAADRHEVTIVLLDEDGRRVGESVFVREFIVDRPGR